MRPAGLTAVCVISLVMGALGGFSLIAGCVGLVAQPLMMDFMQDAMQGMPGSNTPQFKQQMESQQAMMQETLAVQRQWMPFMIAAMVILAVAVAALIIGAIKGLNLKRMAHKWMIIGMAAAVVHALLSGYVGYRTQIDSQAIAMRHVNKTLQATPGGANPAARAMTQNAMQAGVAMGMAIVFGWVLLKCGYYAIATWYLLTPKIRQLFESDGSDRAIIDVLSERDISRDAESLRHGTRPPLGNASLPNRSHACTKRLILLALAITALPTDVAAQQERIVVSADRRGFVSHDSSQPFVPWGFNYDHDGAGRLIEDYWDAEWDEVAEDFREMRTLGANVVRVHLQFGRFMQTAEQPNQAALKQLSRLVTLAEQETLYLDLTGLGCYHKADVPDWYDDLDEQQRWTAQARFWEAIAAACADSPAIFCYDLMNEPVVPGGKQPQENWLGPAFGDKHFVQFITRDRADRPRHDVARQWIETLVAAIRRHDQQHLITVGLVPWSLDRPGLTSGFDPQQVAGELDFIAVHLYPESGQTAEALDTLRGFDIGKPIVIEELFPLKCSAAELASFIKQSRANAAGWIGFYWGTLPDEMTPPKTIGEAITRDWLTLFRERPHEEQ